MLIRDRGGRIRDSCDGRCAADLVVARVEVRYHGAAADGGRMASAFPDPPQSVACTGSRVLLLWVEC